MKETITKGISAIVSTYNGERTLKNALISLFKQKIFSDFSAEIIVVNNNSNDTTLAIANSFLDKQTEKIKLKILNEPKPGKSFAQKKGIENASFEYLIIVDDDNELDENYFESVFKIFEENENVGIINGNSYLPKTKEYQNLPFWWDTYKWTFAVGEFGEKEKFVDSVFGAGMAIRKTIFDKVYKNKDFDFHLTCRKGDSYSSGGDIEHCYLAKLFGYKILYSPQLNLVHHIAPFRFKDEDLQKLYLGIGPSIKILNAYRAKLKNIQHNFKRELRNEKLILFARKVMLLFNKISFNKRKHFIYGIKYLAEKKSLESLKEMGEKEYNQICSSINSLKN